MAKNALKESVIRENITLDEWYEIWLDAYKRNHVREGTILSYSNLYTRLISPSLGGFKFNEITKIQCSLLLTELKEKGYGWETLNSIRILISDMYHRGMEDDYAMKNPMRGVKVPCKKPDRCVKALTKEEQSLFFECSAGTFYHNLFVVAVNTGLRPGELFALTRDDIDLNKKVISVNHTLVYQKYPGEEHKTFHLEDPKTVESKREVPINTICEEALKKQFIQKEVIEQRNVKQHEFSDRLFTTSFNTPLNSVILSDAIKRIVNEINLMLLPIDQLEPFGGHTFRHTFATRALEAGVEPKTIQKYLGHATIQMTMDLYVHVTDSTIHNEIEKVSASFLAINESKKQADNKPLLYLVQNWYSTKYE